MAGRVSQLVIPGLVGATPHGRVSQVVVEAPVKATPNVRTSQVVVEAPVVATPHAKASQVVVEGQVVATPVARMSQTVVEVLILNFEVPMLPIYPDHSVTPGLGYNVKWAPNFWNMPTQTTATGADIDLALASSPTHDFELTYDFLRDNCLQNRGSSEFKNFFGFFLRMGGSAGRFLFRNPDDHSTTGSVVGTTDGVASVFGPITRAFGLGENVGVEEVGYVDTTQPYKVYLDGVEQDPATYELLQTTPCAQQIKFYNTPTAGHVITMDLSYFYYCKFPDNTYTFEKFMHRLWQLNSIKIHSCRAGA